MVVWCKRRLYRVLGTPFEAINDILAAFRSKFLAVVQDRKKN